MPEWPVYVHDAVRPLMVPADSIRPHPDNPHNGDVDAVKDSLLINGLYRPIYATTDGVILAGHTLYAALLDLGFETLPVARIDADAATALRVMLADNRVAELGQDDEAQLLVLLRHLDASNDLLGTGYTPEDVEELQRRLDALGEAPLEPERGQRVRVLLVFTPAQHRAWTRIEERILSTGMALEAGLLDLLNREHEGWTG